MDRPEHYAGRLREIAAPPAVAAKIADIDVGDFVAFVAGQRVLPPDATLRIDCAIQALTDVFDDCADESVDWHNCATITQVRQKLAEILQAASVA